MTDESKKGTERTRREFLATTDGAGRRRDGRVAARSGRGASDTPNAAARCASACATIPSASIPIATSSTSSRSRWPRMTGGLLDFDAKMDPVAGHRDGMGRLGRPEDLDLQAASRRRVPQRRDDRRRGDQVEHRAHPRSQDRPFLHPLGVDRRRARHGRRQAHGALPSQGARARPSTPTSSTTPSTSWRRVRSTRPTPTR